MDWREAVSRNLHPFAQHMRSLDQGKLFLGGLAAAATLAFLLYLIVFQDLPDLSSAKTTISWNPAGLPPTVTFGTYLRIGSKSLPVIGCPPLQPTKDGTGFQLPDLEIKAPLKVDIGFLRTYIKAVDSVLEPELRKKLEKEGKSWVADKASLPKRVPPLFLTSITSSLFIVLVSHPQCPIAMAGAVNTANTFEWTDPRALESYEEFAKKDWQLVARMGGVMQRKKRGAECSLSVDLEDPKTGKVVFKATWGVLKFLPKSAKPAHDPSKDKQEQRRAAGDLSETSIKLYPSARSPRLWAKSCGDYNPIHISNLAAKVFGLPSAIAHGNLMVASLFRAVEVMQPTHPINKLLVGGKAFRCEAAFRSIMQVDKTFGVRLDKEGQFLIVKGDKVCTEGSVTTL